MKHYVSLIGLLFLSAAMYAQETEFESASEAVVNMRVGWNLGNTLDSNSGSSTNMWIERYTKRTPSDYETAWGQPVTKPELFKMMKDAGFNAIRIPVTWYPHLELKIPSNTLTWNMDAYPLGYKVDAAWMKRVHEVVDYVIDQGMYCILNVHHDTGTSDVAWMKADNDNYEENKERYDSLWKQIATEFRDYDEHLLFESYNEIIDYYNSWSYASSSCDGGYDRKVAESAYAAVNGYAETFVNAVRSTGGNNLNRNLVINTYAANSGQGRGTHSGEPLSNLKIPTDLNDDGKNHLIVEIHYYIYLKNLGTAKHTASEVLSGLREDLTWNKGLPVIVGEWGTLDSDHEDVQGDSLYDEFVDYCKYFVSEAKKKKIATFYWMGLSNGNSRSVPEWSQPAIKDAIIRGYYGKNGYTGVEPVVDNYDSVDKPSYADYWLPGGILIRNGRKYLVR